MLRFIENRFLLSKTEDDYILKDGKDETLATTNGTSGRKLSKQNCDELFGIFDVEKLALSESKKLNNDDRWFPCEEVKAEIIEDEAKLIAHGFNKAMELNKDKLFTLEDIKKAVYEGVKIGKGTPFIVPATDDYLKSLQQPTEIEVEIVMGDFIGIGDNYTPENFPKLDSDGCLILKKRDRNN